MARQYGKNPHRHEQGRERAARHREDVARAEHRLHEQQRSHQPVHGSVMVRKLIAYEWRDPQELAPYVDQQFLARWTAPRRETHRG